MQNVRSYRTASSRVAWASFLFSCLLLAGSLHASTGQDALDPKDAYQQALALENEGRHAEALSSYAVALPALEQTLKAILRIQRRCGTSG